MTRTPEMQKVIDTPAHVLLVQVADGDWIDASRVVREALGIKLICANKPPGDFGAAFHAAEQAEAYLQSRERHARKDAE